MRSVVQWSRRQLGSFPVLLLLTASIVLGIATLTTQPGATPEIEISHRPIQVPDDGFVSSTTCKACHPNEYATWYGSYHRTMTQVATSDTVQADFDDVTVSEVPGRAMHLERRGTEFWAEFDDKLGKIGLFGSIFILFGFIGGRLLFFFICFLVFRCLK